MARPYSYDFRRRVIEAVELDGIRKSDACDLFHISRNTLHLWLQRKAETGDVKAKPRGRSTHPRKINDADKFRAFVTRHADKTQVELAQLWEGEVSSRTICRALKTLGLTRKKRPTAIVNAMKQSEPSFVKR